MKFSLLSFVFCVFVAPVFGQVALKQSNWQQNVDYIIDVKLDDQKHTLTGNVKVVYKNNAPTALTELYFHLWPNAYRNNSTEFAKQQVLNGNSDFHFAEETERGGIDGIDFKVNGKTVVWNLLQDQIDICILKLATPLKTGESCEITTPFVVRIPGSFSRFGHVKQDYQITQWFPKPAVYDVNGWNPMSYLDQGEFYSEYGRFEVKITVPKNYIVAATGVLQEESEWKFIRDRRDNPLTTFTGIESSSETKTLTFIQKDIHDFAWFASKYFNVQESQQKLSNGKIVGTFVYAPQNKIKATHFIGNALNFYSDHCGMYPYDYCSVVKGPIEAGGGMEYPMITVVADVSEEVIVHEVGHNWFYGILGSNERSYPWMDESINSYFEGRTMGSNSGGTGTLSKPGANLNDINDILMDRMSMVMDRVKMNQPIGANSKVFSHVNYGLMVYGKGAKAFGYLNAYLGDEIFYKCFTTYFDKWSFKHPLPDDMKQVFEEVSEVDLTWFFKDLLNSDGLLDYRIKSISGNQLQIENNGAIVGPYSLGLYKDGELQLEIWQEGHVGVQTVSISNEMDYDLVKIDPYEILPEVQRKNNTIRKSGLFKKVEPIRVGGFTSLENPNNTTLYVGTILGWNKYNKLMFGAYMSNNALPQSNLRYTLTPLYSPETKEVNGYGNLSYRIYRDAAFNKIELGVKSARFAYQPYELYTYNRVAPYVTFGFRNADKRFDNRNSITLRYTNTSFTTHFDQDKQITDLSYDTVNFNRRTVIENAPDQFVDLIIEGKDGRVINPFSYRFNVQYGKTSDIIHKHDSMSGFLMAETTNDNFIKINLTLEKRINYSLKKKGFDIRIFAGTYLKEPVSGLYQYRIGSQGGRYDYTFEQTVLGRNMDSGVFRNQITPNDMFLKQVGNFGNIMGWAASANLKTDLPGKLPISLYMDLFSYKDIDKASNNKKGEKIGYSGGLNLHIIPKIFEIYMPFFSSEFLTETQNTQGIENFGQRITFTLNLNEIGKITIEDMISKAL